MTKPAEPAFLDAGALDTIAALVFDLAAQLHAERARRLALERALIAAGAIDEAAIAAAAQADDGRAATQASLDRSMARLMAILEEADDARTPLRHERATAADPA